jgi:hypothetical protein
MSINSSSVSPTLAASNSQRANPSSGIVGSFDKLDCVHQQPRLALAVYSIVIPASFNLDCIVRKTRERESPIYNSS